LLIRGHHDSSAKQLGQVWTGFIWEISASEPGKLKHSAQYKCKDKRGLIELLLE